MLKSIRLFLAAAVTVAGFSLGLATFAEAASECKSLESKSACGRRNDCVYVGSYKTSKGTKVSAYCRSKGPLAKKTIAKKKKAVRTKAKTAKKTKPEVKKKVKARAKPKTTKKPTAKKAAAKEKAKKKVKKKTEKK